MMNIEFYPPKQVIEFAIYNDTDCTTKCGTIEENDNPHQFAVYLAGDEIGWYNSVEEAKAAVRDWTNN